MRITDLYESGEILFESYKDFERIAKPVFVQYISQRGGSGTADKQFAKKMDIFREGINRNLVKGQYRDIGYWTKRVSDDGEKGIAEWIDFIDVVGDEIDKRVPKYNVVFNSPSARMKITEIHNIAAVYKLCNRMRLCLRDPNYFNAYIKWGGVYLIEVPAGRFILITYDYTRGYEIWDDNNVELTVDEFIQFSHMPQYPMGTIKVKDRSLEDFIDDVVDEF